jgi:uncharacterized protein YycO
MSYKAGDILVVHNTGLLNIIIRAITRSKFNHVGLFVSDNEVVEATFNGVFKNPISKFDNLAKDNKCYYSVYRVVGAIDSDVKDITNFAISQIGAKYDEMQIARMLLVYVLRLPRCINYPDKLKKWICSELVAEAFARAGYVFSPDIKPDNIVPGDFPKSSIVEKV